MGKVGLRMKDDVEVKDEGLRSGVVQEGGILKQRRKY